MPAQEQDICEKLKNRPGNDDIVIMVDTSLSMIHLIDDIRKQLKDFFQCYIKKGDFIILGTFDSHCRIQFSMKVLKPETDLKLLNLQVDSITPRRKIYYQQRGGQWKETAQPTTRVGGGMFTNLGEMINTVSKVLREFQTPENRKFLLIYTDAINDPPAYIRESKINLQDFFRGIKTEDIKLGLVACDQASYDRLKQLINVIDSSGQWKKSNKVKVITPQTIIDPKLMGSDVWLESPISISPGTVWTPVIDTDIVLHNRMGIDVNIEIKQIHIEFKTLTGELIKIPLEQTPKKLAIKAESKFTFPIKKELPRQDIGEYSGRVVFDITSAVRVVPPYIPFQYTQATFCQTHQGICLMGNILIIVIILALLGVGIRILYLKLKPRWLMAYFNNKDGVDSTNSKKISRGRELRVVGKTQANTEQTLNLKEWMGNDMIVNLKRTRIAKYELIDTQGHRKPYRLNDVATMYRSKGGCWSLIPGTDTIDVVDTEKGTIQFITTLQAVTPGGSIFKFDEEE
jgi:hypothetical protein